jgi:hypothetical protein
VDIVSCDFEVNELLNIVPVYIDQFKGSVEVKCGCSQIFVYLVSMIKCHDELFPKKRNVVKYLTLG